MNFGKLITHPSFSSKSIPNAWENMTFQKIDDPFEAGDGILNIKKEFALENKEIKKATIKATSLGIFDLFLNGKRIGSDEEGFADEYKPGWTDYRIRVYEYEYDIKDLCKENNILTAEVSNGWWSGRISFGFYGYRPTAFAAEIEVEYTDGTSQVIASDENWNTLIGGPVRRADIWDGEYYDATIESPTQNPEAFNWDKAMGFEYDGKILPKVGPSIKVHKELTRVPLSAVLHCGTVDNGTEYGKINVISKKIGANCERTVIKAGEALILDMGQNMVGRPAIEVKGEKGAKIRIHVAETLNDSGDPSRGNDGPEGEIYVRNYRSALARIVYITSGKGVEQYKPKHSFFGFRYIELRCDKDIEVLSVKGEVIFSDFEFTGNFECDHPDVNKLYSNIVWGMRGNYLNVPTDCPQRDERLGWTGDTQIFCGAASYIGDIHGFMDKWLYDLSDSQVGFDGAYSDVAPKPLPWVDTNAAWGEAGLIVPDRIWLMYNDPEIIARQYDSMEWHMSFLAKFGFEGGATSYGDWLNYEITDNRYVAVSYYAQDAAMMAKFSEMLGKKDRVEHYKKLREDAVKYWTDKYIKDGELTVKTQTGYLLPLAFDLVEGEMREKFIKALEQKIVENNYTLSTGFVGTGILSKTLEKVGLSHLAYSLLLQTADPSWLYSVKQGATTIWERWNSYTKERGFGDVAMNSFNHYSYGAVAEWFYSGICGILPDEKAPGFKHFFLQPSPDTREILPEGQKHIGSAKATFKSVNGLIESSWEKIDGSFVYNFTIPTGTVATVKLLAGDEISINGIDFTLEDLNGKKCEECGRIVFDLEAGKYTISVK